MKLYKIIKNIGFIKILGSCDLDIDHIEYDSRKVKKNTLFICIKGFNTDGHRFIDSAIEKGARAILVEDNIDNNKEGVTFIQVKDTKKSMAKVASNFYNNPTNKLFVIGVTGTNGKTTITTFLQKILSLKAKTGLVGTIKIDDGNRDIVSTNTTPESIDLQNYFNTMLENECKYCAMEVSSHSLALDRIDEVNFKIGVFTNLTTDHLDFHKNLEEYRKVKESLFYKTSLANVVNIDDEGGQKILSNIKNLNTKHYTYGIYNKSDFMAKDISLESSGVSYTLVTPTYETKIYVKTPGRFTVYNTLAVISVCYILNIDIEIIKKGLKSINGVDGRFESIKNDKGISVIVDYAHTPDALKTVLDTAKEFVKGKIITVFGCGGNRDKTKRPLMGEISQSNSDICIVTSDNPRLEDPNSIIEDILKGMDISKDNYMVIEDRKEAIKKAIQIAEVNDVVIIAGKGHENYQIIGNAKHHFDDKEIAKQFIESK